MKAHELAKALLELPNVDVLGIYDGGALMEVRHVYLSKSNTVCIADAGEPVYREADRPITAPRTFEEPFWHTPEVEDCKVAIDEIEGNK